jgi:translocation and assembly module TamB
VATVSELLGSKTEVSGQIIFNLDIQGQWSNPNMDGNFHAYKGRIGELRYDDFTGDFTLKDQVLRIQSASLSGANRYRLEAAGSIPLSATGNYDLTVSIPDSSAEMLALWTDGIKKASGRVTAGFTITGPADLPVVNGSLNISDGEIYPARLIKKLSQLDLQLSVKNNRVNIDRLNAMAADGVIQSRGTLTLAGSRVETIDLEVKTITDRGLPINLPGFIDKGEVKGVLRIAGQYKAYRIGGDVELANAHFIYPPKKTSDGLGGEWWNGAQWDLSIASGENTWFENDLAEVNIKGKLAFTGSSEDIKVSGQITAVRGTLRYLGTDFRIRQAALEFHNNTAYLDGEAEAAVSADTIVLEVSKSKLEEVRPRFYSRSDPQLPQEKVVAKLMYGSDINNVAKEDQSKVLVRELLKVMDNTLNTKIIKPVVRKMGLDKVVDVVQVRTEVAQRSVADPQASIWQGSELKVGKYLTNRVFLGYNTILEQSVIPNKLELKHQLEMDYQLKGSKYLKMHIDEKERFLGIENQIRF